MRIKEIPGFEGRYAASDDGRVFSLMDFMGRSQFIEKKQYTDKYGYKCCMFYVGGKRKHMTIHRCVMLAFVPNVDNLPQINHKDGDKTNNNLSNLEWCTASENVQHSYDMGLNVPHQSPWKGCASSEHPRAKKVLMKKDGVEKVFGSGIEASYFLGLSRGAVQTAIRHRRKCAGWEVQWMPS